ncbi:hypothetical protein Tco_0487572 [Tanacetum coccineum]
MQEVQVQLVMRELRTELGMQIQVKLGRLNVTTASENRMALDEEQLLLIAADDCDAFDSDVDEAPIAQTMFMANLSSADPVYDEASPSYDLDILSEVPDHDNYQDAVCEHHEVHKIHDDVQPNHVVDSHADYTSDSNMIPYDQYVKDNAVSVVQTKNDLRNAYEKCNDISQESRALIDSFLKEGFAKDYELNLSMYRKAEKLEKQMDAKLAWLLEKYYYHSQESVGCSSSQTDLYLTEKELHQLHLDEEALRETLEEQAMDEKAREEKIRQKQVDDDEFFMEFGVVRYDSEYESSD